MFIPLMCIISDDNLSVTKCVTPHVGFFFIYICIAVLIINVHELYRSFVCNVAKICPTDRR
jgi:hypothetical protein